MNYFDYISSGLSSSLAVGPVPVVPGMLAHSFKILSFADFTGVQFQSLTGLDSEETAGSMNLIPNGILVFIV